MAKSKPTRELEKRVVKAIRAACAKHPRYQGIKKPRLACAGCWLTYFSGQHAFTLIHQCAVAALKRGKHGK